MPEKGWAVLSVREETARRITEMARAKGQTLDETITELITPAGKEGWSICEACGVRVGTSNLQGHMGKVHPKLTVKP
jgi:hypothetical protein